jgi:hypothetical protein
MDSKMAAYNQNFTGTGMNSTSWSVPLAGVYPLTGKLQIPTITDGGGSSSVVVTISQTPLSGSPTTIYTGPAGAAGFGTVVNCAVQDTIAVVLSSSNPDDTALNAVRSTISFG